MPQAAGRGGHGRSRGAVARRAFRRSSSRTTFGRGTGFGRTATRTRWRCISPPLCRRGPGRCEAAGPLSSRSASAGFGVADRARTGTARLTTSGARRYTTATRNLAGTAGLEPAASRLTSECSEQLSYAPRLRWRGWDSNPRLELMRLARKPLLHRARSGWQDSSLRSPVPETGGMASLPYSQAKPPRPGGPPAFERGYRAGGSPDRSRSHDTFGISRTMFSKPLAHPSALDRRQSTSYVEGLWSPSLERL
jgi:hypothetical protein